MLRGHGWTLVGFGAGCLALAAGGLWALGRSAAGFEEPPGLAAGALVDENRRLRAEYWEQLCTAADLRARNLRLAAELDALRRQAVRQGGDAEADGGPEVPAAGRIPPQNLPVPVRVQE